MDKYKLIVKGIVRCDDKYLIVKKWYDDRIEEPYQWEFVNGVVEFGESPDKAVVQNVLEKTGIETYISKIMYTWSFMTGDTCNIGVAYLCMTAMDEAILSEDLIESKWVTRDEFKKYIMNKDVLHDIEKALFQEGLQ